MPLSIWAVVAIGSSVKNSCFAYVIVIFSLPFEFVGLNEVVIYILDQDACPACHFSQFRLECSSVLDARLHKGFCGSDSKIIIVKAHDHIFNAGVLSQNF